MTLSILWSLTLILLSSFVFELPAKAIEISLAMKTAKYNFSCICEQSSSVADSSYQIYHGPLPQFKMFDATTNQPLRADLTSVYAVEVGQEIFCKRTFKAKETKPDIICDSGYVPMYNLAPTSLIGKTLANIQPKLENLSQDLISILNGDLDICIKGESQSAALDLLEKCQKAIALEQVGSGSSTQACSVISIRKHLCKEGYSIEEKSKAKDICYTSQQEEYSLPTCTMNKLDYSKVPVRK